MKPHRDICYRCHLIYDGNESNSVLQAKFDENWDRLNLVFCPKMVDAVGRGPFVWVNHEIPKDCPYTAEIAVSQ